MSWQIEKIIEVANAMLRGRGGYASTGEAIAAAFVLNRPDFFPAGYRSSRKDQVKEYDMVGAWQRLDDWQRFVIDIKANYMHLVQGVNDEG